MTGHDFTSHVSEAWHARFQHPVTGVHVIELVLYARARMWKARNATTRAHYRSGQEQRLYESLLIAQARVAGMLEHWGFRRLSDWQEGLA